MEELLEHLANDPLLYNEQLILRCMLQVSLIEIHTLASCLQKIEPYRYAGGKLIYGLLQRLLSINNEIELENFKDDIKLIFK